MPPSDPRKPLAKVEPLFDAESLVAHVKVLTTGDMEGRGLGTPGIERAASYIATQFKEAGLEPGGDNGSYFQQWQEETPDGRTLTMKNVIGVIPGSRTDWEGQSVVLGAHYDHLGYGWPDFRAGQLGKVHPGADDNASGVAVLLEMAKMLRRELVPQRTLVFAAFSAEEWSLKGSKHYVAEMKKWPASEVLAMINLDSVGRLNGRKLMLLGAGSADEWPHIGRGIGFTTGVESMPVGDDLGGSDQKSFLAVGVPAIQVFGGAHPDYHWPTDTADKIDSDGLVKTAIFVREALTYLSDRDRKLTSRITLPTSVSNQGSAPPTESTGRRVSLGTLPDFTYPGPGIRIDQVIPGSPAEEAGMLAGDLILEIDSAPMNGLRAFSDFLLSLQPGDRIEILLRRDDQEITVEATVKER